MRKAKQEVILVVEDEPTVLALGVSVIEEAGFATLSAANAREAIALLEKNKSIFLLFTDINLPDGPEGADGLKLARRARELHPDLHVLYTTGGAPTDGMTTLFVEGATFLPKPYRCDALLEAIGKQMSA